MQLTNCCRQMENEGIAMVDDRVVEISAYKVPKSIRLTEFREELYETEKGVFILKYPILSAGNIAEISRTVQENRNRYLAGLSISDIVAKIDLAVQQWLNPDYRLRQIAEILIPRITGYDSEMVRLELKRYIRMFRKKELLRFLDEEFDQPAMLDEFRPRKTGGMSKAFGPRSIFHVFSGNVPGVQIWSLIMGLLLKSANIGKTSTAEPLFPVLFAETLKEVDPLLAESIAILPWKGGTKELEEQAIAAAEAVIVYGSNTTVEKIRELVPFGKKLLTYGHKISLALIGKEALTADYYFDTIHKLAEDVSVYDQQSCLSPQSVLVEEGGAVSPKQFAQMLAAELERYHKKRPRAKLAAEEAMSIQKVRNHYHLESLSGDGVSVFASQNDSAWTVIYHPEPGMEGSPLNRTIHVFSSKSLEVDFEKIMPYQDYLQSCGLAVSPVRLFQIAELLGKMGVNRIAPIGEMNRAKPGWHHDGGFNLLDLVRFTDIERNLEQDLERFDPDVE
ncbi:acyl-CoA reductase [Bacillus sp. UNC438CL73TsuS30]|uniref:acyl-CoA reductase n=1 Tax=Bacillus sp. UNC438CL73TsuS30 TaxID=1340434 RepID=UPI001E3B3AA9|nr:acyl-CoA reductase [Bacillus sp. UNC438CL73TsuS30]